MLSGARWSKCLTLMVKCRWVICIAISLSAALVYDHFRNLRDTEPQQALKLTPATVIHILNPIFLKDPNALQLQDPAGKIDATSLYVDFINGRGKKYIGKTYRITGSIIEEYRLRVREEPESNYLYPMNNYRSMRDITPGIMLLPETKDVLARLSQSGISFPSDPSLPLPVPIEMDAVEYEREYAKLLQAIQPEFDSIRQRTWDHYRDYSLYSDDFSFRSHFGGVYCMFNVYRPGSFAKPKTKITALCRIYDYRKAGLAEIESDKLKKGLRRPTIRPTVIAVGCIELDYELSNRH
jgi:hypothetical protein